MRDTYVTPLNYVNPALHIRPAAISNVIINRFSSDTRRHMYAIEEEGKNKVFAR